jgi:hypothetical protein
VNRRSFLRSLLGTAVTAAVPAPITYVLAPPCGWSLGTGGLFMANSWGTTSSWQTKTPQQILDDVNALLEEIGFVRTPYPDMIYLPKSFMRIKPFPL